MADVRLTWEGVRLTHSLADLLFLSTTNSSFNVNLRAEHNVPRVAAKSIKVNFIKFPFSAMKYKKGGELPAVHTQTHTHTELCFLCGVYDICTL